MTGRRIARNFGSSILNIVSALLVNLWLLRVVAQEFEGPLLGVYWLVQQGIGYLAILQLGLDFAASRAMAERLGAGDRDGAIRAYRQLVRFNRYVTVIVLIVTALVAMAIWQVSSWPVELVDLAVKLLVGAGVALAVTVQARAASAALMSAERAYLVNLVGVGRSIASTFLALALIKGGIGLTGLVVAEVIGQLAAWLLIVALARAYCPWIREPVDDPNRGFRGLFRYAAVATLGGVAWSLDSGSDVFLIEAFHRDHLAAVAIFGFWWRFPLLAFTLCTNLAWSAFPSVSTNLGKDPARGRIMLTKLAGPVIALAGLSQVGLSVWLTPFVRRWYGEAFALAEGPRFALLLGLLIALRVYGNLLGTFYLATGSAGLTTILSWIQLAAKVFLAIWLVRIDGLPGLVTASCVSALIQIAGLGWALLKTHTLAASVIRDATMWTIVCLLLSWYVGPNVADGTLYETALGIVLTVLVVGGILALWARMAVRSASRIEEALA